MGPRPTRWRLAPAGMISVIVSGSVALEDGTGGRFASLAPTLALRPSPRMKLALQPSVSWNLDPAQYARQERSDRGTRYLFARVDQTTAALTTRLSYTFPPELSLRLYAQPFISAGEYTGFREVADPRAHHFDARFRPVETHADPDFNLKQLRSNAVLRWEWRPGSMLIAVWNLGRGDVREDGSFALSRDVDRLFAAEGTDEAQLLVRAVATHPSPPDQLSLARDALQVSLPYICGAATTGGPSPPRDGVNAPYPKHHLH